MNASLEVAIKAIKDEARAEGESIGWERGMRDAAAMMEAECGMSVRKPMREHAANILKAIDARKAIPRP